ncbi:MAG: AraC family transcriptional regulator [Planctomycetes bacterium]|nr:AraC family transcriptional regulator [Planctomycetota bacterium]
MSRSPAAELFTLLDTPFTAETLFDALTDVVYFVKDERGRYVVVNRTLVERVGAKSKAELLGRVADELFPAPFGARYREQDERLLKTGAPVQGALELHVYPSGRFGWCLTHKLPLRDAKGRVRGLVGTSRDLGSPEDDADYRGVAHALEHVQKHLDRPLKTLTLARIAGLSPYQLDQRLRRLFGTTTKEHVQRRRLDRAMHLLRESELSIAEIAQRVGYADQSSFTRVFKRAVGTSPGVFRELGERDPRSDGP